MGMQSRSMKKIALKALMPLFLLAPSGCSYMNTADVNKQWQAAADDVVFVETDPVAERIAQAAERAAAALEIMSLVEQARSPVDVVPEIKNAPPELRQTVTVTWTGPVENITQLLAEVSGYKFATIGYQPPVPVVVDVNAVEQPIIDVLRDIGLQVGRVAEISVDAQTRSIEVRYAPISGH